MVDIHPNLEPKIRSFLNDVMDADGNVDLSKLLKLSLNNVGM